MVGLEGPAHAALEFSGAEPAIVGTRINATGRTLRIQASLTDNGDVLGDVPVEIGSDDRVTVDRSVLAGMLEAHVSRPVMERLALVSPGLALVPVDELKDLGGAGVSFNSGDMGLVLRKSLSGAATTDIPLSRRRPERVNRTPAAVSGFVNVTTSVDAIWDSPAGPPVNMNLEFSGAANVLGLVLEAEGRLDGPLDNLMCPSVAECTYTHKSGFKRGGTRLVAELEEPGDVITIGDISYAGYALINRFLNNVVPFDDAPLRCSWNAHYEDFTGNTGAPVVFPPSLDRFLGGGAPDE
jgi:hypothetical protein